MEYSIMNQLNFSEEKKYLIYKK